MPQEILMHRPSRLPWIVLLAGLALALSVVAPAFAGKTEKLFFIQRSKNKSEVHYDARLTAKSALDASNPIDAYWLRPDTSRGPISTLQKMAYGYDVEPLQNGSYYMKLTALKQRPILLFNVNGRWRAQATIGGKTAYLHHLYVATDESGLIPKVRYIDVFGEEKDTGKAIQERLVDK
jgi:hypothetical protein